MWDIESYSLRKGTETLYLLSLFNFFLFKLLFASRGDDRVKTKIFKMKDIKSAF